MALDTRMGYMTPDEGLVQPATMKKRGQKKAGPQPVDALKVKLERRKAQLNIDRMTWYSNWRDLAENFLPYRGRFMVNDAWDTNKGWRRNWAIVNSTPLQCNNILRAGLMSGTASEARPWFTYELSDEELMEAPGVKEWLSEATKRARDILARSNFYNALAECFGEYGVFGVMALGREWPAPRKREEDIPHFQPFTIGSYYVGNDRHRRVNVWFRDFRWTVWQVVEKFACRQADGSLDTSKDETWENISRYVKGMYLQRQFDQWVSIVHAVEENDQFVPGALGWRGMRYRSVYYERGGEPDRILKDSARKSVAEHEDDAKNLRVAGFRDFPIFVARWYTNSEDAWGRGPAMDCLGDARALQLQEKRKAQAIDKHVDPPMVAHPSLRNQRTSLLPGDVTFAAPDGNQIGFQPAYTIKPDMQDLNLDIDKTEKRIQAVLHADVFALFIQAEREGGQGERQTAAEVNAKQQEKLLMLGPVLGQMNFDLFNPLHDWLFATCLRHGKFPPLPQALRKATIKVKYISILAQAINQVTAQAITSLTQYVLQIGQLEQMTGNPALDKFDADKAIERMASAVGAPPELVRSDSVVAQLRNARAAAQEQQQKQQQALQAAQTMQAHSQTAQNMSQTPTKGGSLLDVMAQAAGAGGVNG
jgi:Bacteriophage head to tail connecting protein